MDRGAWQATIHGGRKRVGQNLATKQQQQRESFGNDKGINSSLIHSITILTVHVPNDRTSK